jgi:hypothetical protein
MATHVLALAIAGEGRSVRGYLMAGCDAKYDLQLCFAPMFVESLDASHDFSFVGDGIQESDVVASNPKSSARPGSGGARKMGSRGLQAKPLDQVRASAIIGKMAISSSTTSITPT